MADCSNSTALPSKKWEEIDADLDRLISDAYQLRGMVLVLAEHIEGLFFPAAHKHPTSEGYYYMSPRDREILGFATSSATDRADVLDSRLESLNEAWHAIRKSVL